jgi:hypothetical protein
MELDDLKHQWKQADKTQKPINQNIMELIQHRSRGPVAALKRSFRKANHCHDGNAHHHYGYQPTAH